VLIGIAIIALLYFLYVQPTGLLKLSTLRQYLRYYLVQVVAFVVFIPLAVFGIRGGATTAVRPITISNANQYVNRPTEAAIVLNTPFSMIRTIGKNVFKDPQYFTREELSKIYEPIVVPSDTLTMQRKNVVVLILESFSREFIAGYNDIWGDASYKGYAPFMDELLQHSLTFDYTFANGRKSIDGMPSILSSIPHFIEPFFLTPASVNEVSGIAGELGKKGYYSAFFHGAENGSMGFEAFARTTKYNDYFGRTEYNQDKRFGGDADFDGTWAIWDEEFMQFFALQMSDMPQPFVTSLFTASSHHPYSVPERYRDIYPDEPGDDNMLHKCIRYVDDALRKFFETAQQQPWYDNTLFVITADHTNLSSRPEYQTDLGLYGAPIIFFDPSGQLPVGRRHCIAQQIDIMPTVLGYLGYDEPYVAFGSDLLHTADADTWAVNNNNGMYQFVKSDYVMQFTDDGVVKAIYNYRTDWFMHHNLKGQLGDVEADMERTLKAIIQQYMIRMTEDKLVVRVSDTPQ
jgi:phosphoglycerol transferase MdoB-like AlkP superfamily enzyme